MKTFIYITLFCCFAAVAAANDLGDDDIIEIGQQEIHFEFLNKETQSETPIGQSIVGHVGTLDAASFPGVLQFRSNGHRICTAALVSPRALLTAAHCLNSQSYSILLVGNRIPMKCYHSSTYSRGIKDSNDWALCKLERKVPETLVDIYETLDIANRPQVNDVVMLTGYGCTEEGGPPANQLLYGYGEVVNRPARVPREDTAFWTQATVGDPTTSASLCAGDSGGPAFVTGAGGPLSNPRIVGINSRVHYSQKISWFSATASNTGIRFFNSWVRKLDTPVCGLEYQGQIYERNCRR